MEEIMSDNPAVKQQKEIARRIFDLLDLAVVPCFFD
jgi:hypothetical protein